MQKNNIQLKPKDLQSLYAAVLALKTQEECERFFHDLCTPIEIHAMSDRWYVAKELIKGEKQRIISRENAISVATIVRVGRFLRKGAGGYRLILKRLGFL